MDHDDYWFPDKLELQFEEMCKNQEAGLVYNSFIPWLPDAKGVFPEPHSFELASYSSHIDEEFSAVIDGELEQNFEWMRTVTKEESDNTRKNLINWAKEGKIPKGGQLGEWIFNQEIFQEPSTPTLNYILSTPPNAAQRIVFYNYIKNLQPPLMFVDLH